MKYFPFAFLFALLFSCGPKKTMDPEKLVSRSIQAHKANFKDKKVSFSFREIRYSFKKGNKGFIYTRTWKHDSIGNVRDVLINNSDFFRIVNKDTIEVSDEWAKKYSSSINSVIYFFRMPKVLKDEAAIKKYLGEVEIKGKKYSAIEVTFLEKKGGDDHEDRFIYWIHSSDYTVDYFAYSYKTDGGGVRFRQAINRKENNGHVFQDYINFEAEKGTPLEDLPKLFMTKKLKELSRIKNKNIKITGSKKLK